MERNINVGGGKKIVEKMKICEYDGLGLDKASHHKIRTDAMI